MGLMSWNWLKKEVLSHKRRVSAPPAPAINYDPNANREQYLQAFDEFKQRGSLYNQLTIREESEETDGSPSRNIAPNKATSHTEANNNFKNQPNKSGKTKRRSLPSNMSRSMLNESSHKTTNTPNDNNNNNASIASENNNSISNEIIDFEDNCINDSSFGASGQSPPKTFYRNNSNPFSPSVQRTEVGRSVSSAARKARKKLEESRQRGCGKLLKYIRPNAKTENSSNSSGAYKQYDLDSILSDDEQGSVKKSNGQDIPVDVYKKIVNVFGHAVQNTGSNEQCNTHNSPVKPTIPNHHQISGMSPMSGFTSFRRCEGVIDENFEFLNDTQWKGYLMDESELFVTNDKGNNVKVTDLDESISAVLSQHGQYDRDQANNDASSFIDSVDQWTNNIDTTMSPQANKHPIYIIECRAKDIKPKTSALRNTILTPFDFSSGSFRKTTVTLKKCCPRDSASIRLVEEAIERDYEILCKVKHPNIVILMAACFHRKLINHMTLVLEPVDYTLNFYLHQMDRSFNILESISIIQQISSAALYLQECGYIHSNISSHNVLIRERPWSVKLSSFELATDVDCSAVRAEVEINYPQWYAAAKCSESSSVQQSTESDADKITLKEQYRELSKRPLIALKRSTNAEQEYMGIPSKYLIYDTVYRQRLSMHNFLAPELLTTDQRFVFPTTKTDVYSLCLLLWEILNQCVPFAVYSKLDMERMIANKKLNLPFFERQRCYFFMDIFRAGLAVNLEDRTMDVPHLIELLEDIELEILTGGEDVPDQSDDQLVAHKHGYVNSAQHAQTEHVDDTVPSSSSSSEPIRLSGNHVNSMNDFILSPSLLDFDQSLKQSERTSTKKLKKKPPRKHINRQIRELFPAVKETLENVNEAPEPVNDKRRVSSFVDLNESFIEISDDIRRHVFDDISEDEKLTENLAVIADDIRRKILNDTAGGTAKKDQQNKIYSEVKRPSLQQPNSKPIPSVVGFSIKSKKLNDSKTYGNILEAPVSTSCAAKKLFGSSPSDRNIEGEMYNAMPTNPIARRNYIRRNAWLSNQQPASSTNETKRMTEENTKKTTQVNDDKKVNVSVRIVHNKISPRKAAVATKVQPISVDEGRPSILSKIKFFNSANETSKSDTSLPSGSGKAAKVDEVAMSNKSMKSSNTRVNERIATVAPDRCECVDNNYVRSDPITNERKTVIDELTDAVHNLHNSALNQPQQKQLFENKLWKRELDICNRSLNSSDGVIDSQTVAPRFRSVRDAIMKFEKRGDVTRSPSSTDTSPTELVKSFPQSIDQQNHRKPNGSPTLIKRTVYSEQIVSGVDLSPLDNRMPIFDKFNFGRQKVATRLSMRQVRQTSSDVGVTGRRQQKSEKNDVRHTICGSEMELLSFNAGTFSSPGVGPSSAVTKYICFNCASRMSSDELKALTYEPFNSSMNSDANAVEESLIRRCQARVKSQDTRSIEDLYIDDDFGHGLGANMELQSDCSDLLDFDIISSGLFNSNYSAAEKHIGN